jgi:uncharacterized protein
VGGVGERNQRKEAVGHQRDKYFVCMYNKMVSIEFDPAKNEANIAKHGIDMASAEQFEFDTALVNVDTRHSYGEVRHFAIGYIGERLHVLVFARRGSKVRVISLRKANRREERAYREKA